MNADQLIEAIGKTVAASKPADEYCFLWIDWWGTCMTKAEWAGWAQAIGATAAVFISIFIINREIKEGKKYKREERVKELRAIRLVLDKYPLESRLSSFIGHFSGFSKRYKNETKFMADFNSIFVFVHTIKSYKQLLNCINEIPKDELENLKLSFVGDEIRRIILDIKFMDSIYVAFEDSIVEFDFLKNVVSSNEFIDSIKSRSHDVRNIESDLEPMLEIIKDNFNNLTDIHSRLNKKIYGDIDSNLKFS